VIPGLALAMTADYISELTAPLRDSANYPFGVDIPTRYADMDIYGHVNNVALMSLFEDARVRFFKATGAQALLGERRLLLVVAHTEYLGETRYPDPVHVRLGVLALGRSSWTVAQLALQRGVPCGYFRAKFVSAVEGGKALPMLDAHRRCLAGQLLHHLRSEG